MIDALGARQEVFNLIVNTISTTDWATEIGYPSVNQYYQGREMPSSPPGDEPHIKAFIRHADGGQGSLTGSNGYQLYENDGLLIIQAFGPQFRGDGLEVAIKVATILGRALKAKQTNPGCVWFRRCRIQEEEPSGNWDQCNLYCTITYHEVINHGL